MSEKIEEKAVELMDRSADAIEAFATKLQSLASEYGPEVVDAALWVARVDALQKITLAVLLAVLAAIAWGTVRPLIRWGKKVDPNWESPAPALGYLSGILGSILGLIALIKIFDPWPWVGVIEPQIWIAKRVLGL